MPAPTPIRVLIVDDSRADARLAELWLRKSRLIADIQIAATGQEALVLLQRESAPLPHLVLLDVNLPDMLGWDLLSAMRSASALASIPVIVLTGTMGDRESRRAAELGAASCLGKPFDADEFSQFVNQVEAIVLAAQIGQSPDAT